MTRPKQCTICHGDKSVPYTTPKRRDITIVCPGCHGKGFVTKADRQRYYDSWNLTTRSHEKSS